MLNLIVFIGDKAQVNYMDGYTTEFVWERRLQRNESS